MNVQTLKYQRDLYRLLLQEKGTDGKTELLGIVCQIVDLLVKYTIASFGYVELLNGNGKSVWSTYRFPNVATQKQTQTIQRSIVENVLKNCRPISTPLAGEDLGKNDGSSRRASCVKLVYCVPLISKNSSYGVIYLQGNEHSNFDVVQSSFDDGLFTNFVSPLLNRLVTTISDISNVHNSHVYTTFSDIIGFSPNFRTVLKEAMMISDLDVHVLITGETGTGKSLIVKAIHRASSRRSNPFVHLNCAVLPEQLVESELFGSLRGAHSSAYTDIPGKIVSANGGTLFLDEIGELPLPIQAKFLQFLEEGFFYPLGSKSPLRPDVRVIAASNANFDDMITNGRFRSDLYYRLNVFTIHVPSLSTRIEDIPELVRYFVTKHSKAFNIPPLTVSEEAIDLLMTYSYPGNVRQLENVCQQAIIRAYKSNASRLDSDFFSEPFCGPDRAPEKRQTQKNLTKSQAVPVATFHTERVRWEKAFLSEKLQSNNWNISKTAASIGLSRSHMNNLVKHYSLRKGKDA